MHNRLKLISNDVELGHSKWHKPLKNGWFVFHNSNTSEKYRQLLTIKEALHLDMNIEMGYGFEVVSVISDAKPRTRNVSRLMVKMPDGLVICDSTPIDTYIHTLFAIGINAVTAKNIQLGGMNLITNKNENKNQIPIDENHWATFPVSTKDKCKWLKIIAAHTKVRLEVKLI